MRNKTNQLVKMAILTSLSMILVMNIHFPIFTAAPFLEYDPADIPLLIGTFIYGPIAGLFMTVVACLIQAMTVSASSGWVGFVMHFIATGTLVLVAGTIYKYKHSFFGVIIALIAGSIAMTAVMVPANLFFTVKFWGTPLEQVKALLPTVLIPFNLIKASANSVITVIVYQGVSTFLRSTESIVGKTGTAKS